MGLGSEEVAVVCGYMRCDRHCIRLTLSGHIWRLHSTALAQQLVHMGVIHIVSQFAIDVYLFTLYAAMFAVR